MYWTDASTKLIKIFVLIDKVNADDPHVCTFHTKNGVEVQYLSQQFIDASDVDSDAAAADKVNSDLVPQVYEGKIGHVRILHSCCRF